MKRKRTLLMFVALLFAVCVPCAFLAGCADNETNKDDGSDVGNNVSDTGSDTDFDYSLVTGDKIFNEGLTLDELKEYFAEATGFSMYGSSNVSGSDAYYNYVFNGDEYIMYEAGEELNWSIMMASFKVKDYRYDLYYTGYGDEDPVLKKEKSLAAYGNSSGIGAKFILSVISENVFTEGNSGLEINDEYIDIDEDYFNEEKYTISKYLNLKGSLLECGFIVEGKPGTEAEGYQGKDDWKIYGINSTKIEIPDVDLSDATWSDRVEYNGITYKKAADSDGNEYYYVSYNPGSAEPEKTINTLPVKASHE